MGLLPSPTVEDRGGLIDHSWSSALTDYRLIEEEQSRRPVRSQKSDSGKAKRERVVRDILRHVNGKKNYEETMEQLKKEGHWNDTYYSYRNAKLVRHFFIIKIRKMDTGQKGPFVNITLDDFAWWVRSGPELGAEVNWDNGGNGGKGRNENIEAARTQLVHFIDSVAFERATEDLVGAYEKKAEQLGQNPWSGNLVTDIVKKARSLQKARKKTKRGPVGTLLESIHIRDALAIIFPEPLQKRERPSLTPVKPSKKRHL